MNNTEKLLDITDDILVLSTSDGHILSHNSRWENLFPALANSSDFSEVLTDFQFNLLKYYMDRCLETNLPQKFEIQVNDTPYLVKIQRAEETLAICFKDVKEEYKLRQSLNETLYRLDFASKIAKMGYWELDLKSKKVSWSNEMFRLFGVASNENLVNKNIIKQIIYKRDWPKYKEKLQNLIKTQQPIEGIIRLVRADQKTIYCRYKAELVQNEYNRKIMGTFQDVTELMEIQQTLENAKKAAEMLTKNKSDFLKQTSHDMQQPMAAMSLFIDNLLDGKLTNRQQILVGKIHNSATSLQNYLNNILDMSKLEKKDITPNKKQIKLQDIFKQLKERYDILSKEEGIKIKVVKTEVKIYTDPFLLERILNNYLSNALKYCHNKILLGVKKRGKETYICVLDNGEGIASKEQPFIFDEYYQGKAGKKSPYKGSGLGLYIVKKIANLLKLQVGMTSEPSKGSCFYIKF